MHPTVAFLCAKAAYALSRLILSALDGGFRLTLGVEPPPPVLEFKVPEGSFEFKVPEGLHGVDRLPHNVNVRVAGVGSTLPAGSRARIRMGWLPKARPTFLHFFFLHFLAA